MPEIEIAAAGKSVSIKADEASAKSLAKLALKLWNDIEIPGGHKQPFGIGPAGDQVADDSLRYDRFDSDNGRMEGPR